MKRPFATRIPRCGSFVLRGRLGFRFWSDRASWGSPTRYTFHLWTGPVPDNWMRILLDQIRGRNVKKPLGGRESRRRPYFDDDSFQADYPNLYEAMASSSYEDGTPKGPGVLIIKGRDHQVSLSLKIEGSGLMIRLAGPGLVEVLLALDALLGSDAAPWEEDPYAAASGARKKKSG